MIKVSVIGALGKMGQELCRTIIDDNELELVGAVDIGCAEGEMDIGQSVGRGKIGVNVSSDIQNTIDATNTDVAVDFTHPSVVVSNIEKIISCGADGVIGTTGIDDERIAVIQRLLHNSKSKILIAPNFAIGAVLMMKLSHIAAKYLNNVEIIELHHEGKADAPSGTAIATAKKIIEAHDGILKSALSKELVAGARGGEIDGIKIHSVRLPGYVAHQEVIFGEKGQTLTIRHDSTDRTSFMPGVVKAIKTIDKLDQLTIGLENILDLS